MKIRRAFLIVLVRLIELYELLSPLVFQKHRGLVKVIYMGGFGVCHDIRNAKRNCNRCKDRISYNSKFK